MKSDRDSTANAVQANMPPLVSSEQTLTDAAASRADKSRADRPARARHFSLRWWSHSGGPLLVAALLTLVALWPRADFALDVGTPSDRLFLTGVHGDERVAEYTYRWTGKNGAPTQLSVPGFGAVRRLRVVVRAQALPERAPVAVRVLVAGQSVGMLTVSGTMAEQSLEVVAPAGAAGGDLHLAFDAPTSTVPGDQRALGIKLDSVRLTPLERDGAIFWQTLWWHLFGALALVAVCLLLIGKRDGWRLVAGRYGGALVVPLALGLALPWALAILPAALWLAALAFVVRWREQLLRLLVRLWAVLDRPRVADWVAATGLMVYAVAVLPHLLAVPWINHADYADNAVVARNLVRGNGFSVDYVAQFYRDWPTPRHAADTWPPLQPLLIAVAFALFGVSTGIANLPNLLVMLGLLGLVYRVGRTIWSPRVGLLAAVLIALHPDLFDGVIYPLNDTAFTLLTFGCIVLAWRLVGTNARRESQSTSREWAFLGVLAGLLVLCKPSGALVLGGVGLWALVVAWRQGTLRRVLRDGGVAVLAAGVVWLPWGIRNQLTFGQPFYSTESYDAWLIGFRDWENIYRVYGGTLPLPHRSLLVGYGFDAVTAKIALQFRKAWQDLSGGVIVVAPLLPLIVLGGLATADRARRSLLAALGVAVGLYALFVLTYWHYEKRYALFLLPWCALLGVAGLWWLHDRLAEARGRAVAALLVPLILAVVLWPQIGDLRDQWVTSLRRPNPLVVAEWVRDNTPPGAVVMTRNPWELSFHSERLSVMIPFDDLATIRAIADRYGITYLQLDHLNERDTRRAALDPLYAGPDEWNGFRKVFDRRDQRGEGLLVYTVPKTGR